MRLCRDVDVRLLAQAVFNRMQEKTHKSELVDKWDRIFRDICREIICPPTLADQADNGPHLEIGWQRDAPDFDGKGILHAEQYAARIVQAPCTHEVLFDDRCPSLITYQPKRAVKRTAEDIIKRARCSLGLPQHGDRWSFQRWSPSGWLERCLFEPIVVLVNQDPEHPSDSYTVCHYRGPWRRRFESALRLLSLPLISVWGVALLVLLAGETALSAVTKTPPVGFAIQRVAGVVFLAGVLELVGLLRRNRFVRLLIRRRYLSGRYR